MARQGRAGVAEAARQSDRIGECGRLSVDGEGPGGLNALRAPKRARPTKSVMRAMEARKSKDRYNIDQRGRRQNG